jgi:hypothetical protein
MELEGSFPHTSMQKMVLYVKEQLFYLILKLNYESAKSF